MDVYSSGSPVIAGTVAEPPPDPGDVFSSGSPVVEGTVTSSGGDTGPRVLGGTARVLAGTVRVFR